MVMIKYYKENRKNVLLKTFNTTDLTFIYK